MKSTWLALPLLLALLACSKDDPDTDLIRCATPAPTSLADFARRHGPATQVFEFDPTQPQTIFTAGQAWLEIPADALVLPDGTAPAGLVRLEFQELYLAPDMVLAGMHTMAPRGLLQSGGEFSIRFYAGSTRLKLQANRDLLLNAPAKAQGATDRPPHMGAWYLEEVGPQVSLPWRPSPDTAGFLLTQQFNASLARVVTTYTIRLSNWAVSAPVTWFSCAGYAYDSLSTGLPRGTAQLVVSDPTVEGAEYLAYFLPTGRNGAFEAFSNPQTQKLEVAGIPVGTELKAVVLCARNGRYFFGTQTAVFQPGLIYRPVLQEMSEEAIVQAISPR